MIDEMVLNEGRALGDEYQFYKGWYAMLTIPSHVREALDANCG